MGQCVCSEALGTSLDAETFASSDFGKASRPHSASDFANPAVGSIGGGQKFSGAPDRLRDADPGASTSSGEGDDTTSDGLSGGPPEATPPEADPLAKTLETEWRGPTMLADGETEYEGCWKGTVREGRGVLRRADGSSFEGEFRHNRATGFGKFVHNRGDTYEGEWQDDRANGYGVYVHADGSRYEGAWIDDMQDGFGREQWADGSRFEGYYQRSKKHGQGKFSWAEGSWFEGEFNDNAIHGHGTYHWADGRTYTGEWQNNHMHGEGCMEWPDQRRYEGRYAHDKKHGYGVYRWPDGRRYEGFWQEGKQHGVGTFFNAKGVARRGNWQKGVRAQWLPSAEAADGLATTGRSATTSAAEGERLVGGSTPRQPLSERPAVTSPPAGDSELAGGASKSLDSKRRRRHRLFGRRT